MTNFDLFFFISENNVIVLTVLGVTISRDLLTISRDLLPKNQRGGKSGHMDYVYVVLTFSRTQWMHLGVVFRTGDNICKIFDNISTFWTIFVRSNHGELLQFNFNNFNQHITFHRRLTDSSSVSSQITFCLGALLSVSASVWFNIQPVDARNTVYATAVLMGSGGSLMLVTSLSMIAQLIGQDKVRRMCRRLPLNFALNFRWSETNPVAKVCTTVWVSKVQGPTKPDFPTKEAWKPDFSNFQNFQL